MGTKNNPGNFDCYANADPDEPMFILLARDNDAPGLIDLWADVRSDRGEDAAKVQEARDCAESMRKWFAENKAAKAPASGYSLDLTCDQCSKNFSIDSTEIVEGEKPKCPLCGFNTAVNITDVSAPQGGTYA